MALLTIENLNLGYDGRTIVRDLSFKVDSGDYLCIVGENGSGKTTLMRTLLNLQMPLSGSIILGEGLRRNEIGYLPQQSTAQRDFPASVREIVLSGCLGRKGLKPFYDQKDQQLAKINMEKTGISDLAESCYRELSGGQQQRVLLARALCAAGKVLLLDEPVSGLDPKATSEMYSLISKLNKEGVTIIMISHDILSSFHYASHILHLGSTNFFGSRQQYLESDIGRLYLKLEGEEEHVE